MKISEILSRKRVLLSFEIFPPKKQDSFDSVASAAEKLIELKPDFISITCGAGGTTKVNTASLAAMIQRHGITALPHLTCVRSSKAEIESSAAELKSLGIENILALRGDLPKDAKSEENLFPSGMKHASDLLPLVKSAGFCAGGACYPEGHPESKNRIEDINNLKYKVSAGADFLTTQMFFDNDMFYSFAEKARSAGINVPVLAGIMPVTNASQVEKMIDLSDAYIPRKLSAICDKYRADPKAMRQAGIAYAVDQIIDLISNGVRGIHIYTMNKSETAKAIISATDEIFRAANRT